MNKIIRKKKSIIIYMDKKNIEDFVVYEDLSEMDKWVYDRMPYLFKKKENDKLNKLWDTMIEPTTIVEVKEEKEKKQETDIVLIE
jgi:hypothetical protein